MPQHQPAGLDELLALAEGYAELAMRNIGHVPPAFLADSPIGLIHFVPDSLKDEQAKDNLANTARLICIGYEVTAAVLVLEAWMKMAKPGEALDMTEPPSEAFDRREVVVLTGEMVEHAKQKLLPIIRTDAGGFFGFGEHDGPKFDNFKGRFAQLLSPKRPTAEGRELARAMLAAMGIGEERLRGNPIVKIPRRSVITLENPLSPFCPAKSAGFEFFQVEIECLCHGSSVEPSLSRHLSKSKCREGRS